MITLRGYNGNVTTVEETGSPIIGTNARLSPITIIEKHLAETVAAMVGRKNGPVFDFLAGRESGLKLALKALKAEESV